MTHRYVPYDRALDEFEVAVRALWLLYGRGKWTLLNTLGITLAQHGADLEEASMDLGPRLNSRQQVETLLRHCPFLREAAEELRLTYLENSIPPALIDALRKELYSGKETA